MKFSFHSKRYGLLLSLLFVLPLLVSLKDILTGSIPFWYDPARDFLSALDNLRKPTLLGPPTGIPGVFYGPYWIWLISSGLFISKDPRFIAIVYQFVPYFTIFPYVLFKVTKSFGKAVFPLLWLLFIFSYKNYTTYLWNPHLAPLIFLVLVYILINANFAPRSRGQYLKLVLLGFLSGLLTNFHMAFGVATTLATFLYIARTTQLKKNVILTRVNAAAYVLGGVLLSFLPTIAFELRHGFHQTKAIVKTISQATQGISDITLEGFNNTQILRYFFGTLGRLLQISRPYLLLVYAIGIAFIISFAVRKKIQFSNGDKRLILFLGLIIVSTLTIFLTASNPIWHYHFIGVEIVFLLLVGFILSKSPLLQKILAIWIGYLLLISGTNFVKSFNDNPLTFQSLASKQSIVEQIYEDASGEPFAVFAYSPAIYTYDFDYLFKWTAQKQKSVEPKTEISESHFVYLIIPETSEPIELDFINYKTPNEEYMTLRVWKTPDKTLILKRKRI